MTDPDKQAQMVKDFARDLPSILAGEDPAKAGDYCTKCGMTFKPLTQGAHPEWTVCAEPGCGRWFGHGSPRPSNEVAVYRR